MLKNKNKSGIRAPLQDKRVNIQLMHVFNNIKNG